MTGARARVDGAATPAGASGTASRAGRPRISTPASTIGPWLPEGRLGEALAEGLALVEAALTDAVGSEHPFVREAAGHLMAAGGKRSPSRPARSRGLSPARCARRFARRPGTTPWATTSG